MRRPALTKRSSTLPLVAATARRQDSARVDGERGLRAIERDAVDQVVQRAVVDRRRIAGVHRPDRRTARSGRSTTSVVVEPGGLHRGLAPRRSAPDRFRSAAAGRPASNGRYRDSSAIRDDEHAVEAHGALDRGLRAGLDQVGARAQVVPGERLCRAAVRDRTSVANERTRSGCAGGVNTASPATGIGPARSAGPGRALRRRAPGSASSCAAPSPRPPPSCPTITSEVGTLLKCGSSPERAECAAR